MIVNGERKTVHDISLDVWVIFLMDEIKLVKQIQTYPLWSFGAELGGYTGMFLGVSLLQVTLQNRNKSFFWLRQEVCMSVRHKFVLSTQSSSF